MVLAMSQTVTYQDALTTMIVMEHSLLVVMATYLVMSQRILTVMKNVLLSTVINRILIATKDA